MLLVAAGVSSGGALAFVLSGMMVTEIGIGVVDVPLTIAATGAAGAGERGLASGVLSTSTELGNAFGWALVAAVVAAADAASGPEALVGGFRSGLLVCVGIVVLALPLVLVGLRDGTGEAVRPHRLESSLLSLEERDTALLVAMAGWNGVPCIWRRSPGTGDTEPASSAPIRSDGTGSILGNPSDGKLRPRAVTRSAPRPGSRGPALRAAPAASWRPRSPVASPPAA